MSRRTGTVECPMCGQEIALRWLEEAERRPIRCIAYHKVRFREPSDTVVTVEAGGHMRV